MINWLNRFELLRPYGSVQRSLEIPGEPKWVDLWFAPDPNLSATQTYPNLMANFVQSPCLLEPYRNPPSRREVKSCLLKLFWVQDNLRRIQSQWLIQDRQETHLWIIATSFSRPVLEAFGAVVDEEAGAGIYQLAKGLDTHLIDVSELPIQRDTLFLRLLGREAVQRQAISEVLSLDDLDPERLMLLRIIGLWSVELKLGNIEFEERETVMAFSQAYLELEKSLVEKGLEQGERAIVLRQLQRKFGELPGDVIERIQGLDAGQTEALAEALLDFTRLDDVVSWLG